MEDLCPQEPSWNERRLGNTDQGRRGGSLKRGKVQGRIIIVLLQMHFLRHARREEPAPYPDTGVSRRRPDPVSSTG